MNNYRSFLSEHTVEFSLVSAAKRILDEHYECVVPVYPWMGRELSKMSRELHSVDGFKVLSVFPRRPKKLSAFANEFFVKINWELVEYEEKCRDFKVPVIAGCPMVNNLWELSKPDNIVWIDLSSRVSGVLLVGGQDLVCLTSAQIVDLVEKAPTMYLEGLSDFLRVVKARSFGFFSFSYKPFYFLLR